MRNRTILGLFSIFLAVVVAFGIAPLINRTAADKEDIVRVVSNISQGREITEGDIEIVSVGAHNLPGDIIRDKEAVIGKYAACDLKANDYLLPSKISDNSDNAYDVFKALDGTKQAVSISIDSFAGGLSGKLKNGDIVSVIVANKNSGLPADIPPQLKYVRVITTTSPSGYDADNVTNEENSEMPATITLLVNEEQSKLLTEYEVNAIVHLALVYRGDEETANQFLAVQQQIFEKGGVS